MWLKTVMLVANSVNSVSPIAVRWDQNYLATFSVRLEYCGADWPDDAGAVCACVSELMHPGWMRPGHDFRETHLLCCASPCLTTVLSGAQQQTGVLLDTFCDLYGDNIDDILHFLW